MKYFLLLILALIPCLAAADDQTHLEAAGKLIDQIGSKQIMRDAFVNSIGTLAAGANARVSAAEADDMKQAMIAWFDEDFKWEELRPKLADIYVKAFTEDELNQLIAFYQTPLGKKSLATLPQVMSEGMAVGQQYAQTKQAALMARLQKVDEKDHPATPAPAASSSSPAATPATPAK